MSIMWVCLRGLWLEYIKGSGSKCSFIPDWWPRRVSDLWGPNSWGRRRRTGLARENSEDGETGNDGKMEVKFRIEGRKVRAKENLKRKSAGGETEVVTIVDLEYILVVLAYLFCCSLPWFWCLALVWSSELTPDPSFWPYPLPPATPYRLANMCYLAWTHTHTQTHTHIFSNTESQSHMCTHSYLMYKE